MNDILILLLIAYSFLSSWEGWEPKTSLPTEAEQTLEEQAVYPEPEPKPIIVGIEQWRPIVEVYDWNPDRMMKIMHCESRGVPTASSHTDDHGLLQIHYPIWGPAFGVTRNDLYDPVLNIDIGYRVYAAQGYSAWVCNRYIN